MKDLKPCPFCGCTAIYVTHTHYYDDEDTVCMFCNGCKAHVILEQNEAEGINDKTRAEAIAAWNTRAERTCHIKVGDNAGWWECQSCGALFDMADALAAFAALGYRNKKLPNYCPNCGARVVGE